MFTAIESGIAPPRLPTLKLPAECLDLPLVRAEVPEGEPRRRADMDHAAGRAETAMEVIDEPESVPAGRVEIVVRSREDNRVRQASEESLQPAEADPGVT